MPKPQPKSETEKPGRPWPPPAAVRRFDVGLARERRRMRPPEAPDLLLEPKPEPEPAP